MDINKLAALRELSAHKTMTEVARNLHLSPSAISQQIAMLEQELDIALIERSGRGVELTLAGERLVQYADKIFYEIESARAEMFSLKQQVAGRVRIAAFPSVAAALIPRTLSMLKKTHPRLSVTFEEMEPEESLNALRGWQTDIALIDDLNVPGLPEPNITVMPLMEDVFNVILPPGHHLAKRKKIPLAELRNEHWVTDTASQNYTVMLTAACRASGFDPQIVARCKGFEVTIAMIRGGCAIAILPELRASFDLEGTSVRRVSPELRRRISVGFRQNEKRSPLIRAVLLSLYECTLLSGKCSPGAQAILQKLRQEDEK